MSALKALDRGGTVAVNAIHLDRVPELDYDDLWWERSIKSVANVTRADVTGFLALVPEAGIQTVRQEGRGDDATLVLVTHTAPDAALAATVRRLGDMEAVRRVASVMRVEGLTSD